MTCNSHRKKEEVYDVLYLPYALIVPYFKYLSAKSGAKAIFTVKAKGSKLSYQWQISKDNGKTWKNSGATGNKTATLTVKAEKRLNGTKYRCVVTNGTVKINSNVAILTVK